MPDLAIDTQQLVKQYGDTIAVAGLDLKVAQTTIYALLGPNGAGKTTTINMLITLIPPTSGRALVGGYDVVTQAAHVRQCIGVTFQDIVLDPGLKGREILDIHGRLYRMGAAQRRQQIDLLVQLVQLEEAIDRPVKTYSGGMKRRLELARGLLTGPQVLFLDEPTQGLDPQNRASIWQYIRQLNQEQGLTVLLTTHDMEEAETLAQTVGILDHGQMVVEGTPATLVAALGADVIRLRGNGHDEGIQLSLQQLAFVERIEPGGEAGLWHLFVDDSSRRLADIITIATTNGFHIEAISVAQPSLGDVFLHHTGRALRDP
ncbi:MAG: ATP-binding cassette domain-containing protein [Chloroflexaceae bacterium]|nr:ATP-binding cassette domain-containing protein [Chloroflexaceae bacterium]